MFGENMFIYIPQVWQLAREKMMLGKRKIAFLGMGNGYFFRDELWNYVGCTRAEPLWLEVVDPTWSNDIHPIEVVSTDLWGPSVQRPGRLTVPKPPPVKGHQKK